MQAPSLITKSFAFSIIVILLKIYQKLYVIETSRLEKTCKITQSKHESITTALTNHVPQRVALLPHYA